MYTEKVGVGQGEGEGISEGLQSGAKILVNGRTRVKGGDVSEAPIKSGYLSGGGRHTTRFYSAVWAGLKPTPGMVQHDSRLTGGVV